MKATKAKIEDIKEGDIFWLTEKKDKECVIRCKCISTTGVEVRFQNLDYPEMGESRVTKYSTDKYQNVTIITQ